MSIAAVPGQARVKQLLQDGLRENRLSHAYIFNGPVGTHRKEMALALAKAICCKESSDDACGACLSCRKMEHGNHPSLILLEPDGLSIKIDQIRKLQQQLSHLPEKAETRIYIITFADKMTNQASNSLLKFLEEPLDPLIAIFITENGQALLPTIRSRSQWVDFQRLAPSEMKMILENEGHPPEIVNPAVHLAAGINTAREWIQGNWFAETRNVVIQLAKESLTKLPDAMLTIQNKVVKTDINERLNTLLDLLLLLYKDMIHIQSGRKYSMVFLDQSEWLSSQAYTRSAHRWVEMMEAVVETQKHLRFHANPQLALEKLMIRLNRR